MIPKNQISEPLWKRLAFSVYCFVWRVRNKTLLEAKLESQLARLQIQSDISVAEERDKAKIQSERADLLAEQLEAEREARTRDGKAFEAEKFLLQKQIELSAKLIDNLGKQIESSSARHSAETRASNRTATQN